MFDPLFSRKSLYARCHGDELWQKLSEWKCIPSKMIFSKRIVELCVWAFFLISSIVKPTTLNTNEQEAIRGAVADPVACVVSMPPKYQHVVSSLSSEE